MPSRGPTWRLTGFARGHACWRYVGERAGRVRVIRDGRVEPRPLLDLSGQVVTEGEGGLLGVAAAPDGRHLYLTFTDRAHAVRLVEFGLAGHAVDPASRRDVLTVAQASVRHHGGNLVFGPDGLVRVPGRQPRLRDLGVRLPGLVSFAEDGAGELYLLSLSGGVARLVAAG